MKLKIAGLLASCIVLTACMYKSLIATDPVSVAQSRVRIEDTRDEAVQALSDAWFRSECTFPNSTVIWDLFFYGPKDLEQVKVVVVHSDVADGDGTLKVTFVGGVESYMLHLYDMCEPSPLQAFGEVTPTAIVTPQ